MYTSKQVYISTNIIDEEYGKIALPHSCDEWVIGGREEVRQIARFRRKSTGLQAGFIRACEIVDLWEQAKNTPLTQYG